MSDNIPVMPEVVVTARKPAKTNKVPNPLSKYASYTYSWSFWHLDTVDYNTMINMPDSVSAMNYKLSNKSVVLAEDGGRFPDRRVPGNPLNYNIQSVKFKTAISPGKTNRSSTLIDGSMVILEPYGVTFIENLIEASFDGTNYNNYTLAPYLLQLEFKGYDDAGEPISNADSLFLRKRFPIIIKNLKLALTNKGAEYTLEFAGYNSNAFYPSNSATPKNFAITAGTVGEFFKKLSNRYYEHYTQLVFQGHAAYVESVNFDIDPAIANSSIVNKTETPLTKANSNSNGIDFSKSTFTIPANTPILDIINRVLAQSDFILRDQLKISNLTTDAKKDDKDVFTAFKTTSKLELMGADTEGNPMAPGVIDPFTNRYPTSITYGIRPYPTWSSAHAAMPKLSSSVGYTLKEYKYYYTGQNTEIIDLKLNFDTSYYSAMLGFTNAIAAQETTFATADAEDALDINKQKMVSPPPGVPGGPLAKIPTVTPIQYKRLINNPNITVGMNLSSNPAGQTGMDVVSALQSDPAAAIKLDLTIIGDPTLIKQDDWAYFPSPSTNSQYNDYDTLTQQQFADRYGHIRMDAGELAVDVVINTPMDIDTELINQGLVDPLPNVSRSMFSGRYRILTIENTFSAGKFEQKLNLARYMNDEFSAIFQPTDSSRSDAVSTSQSNQMRVSQTNVGDLMNTPEPGWSSTTTYYENNGASSTDGYQIRR